MPRGSWCAQDAIEQTHLSELFWRDVIQKGAATITMGFVLYLLWARYTQLRAAKAETTSGEEPGAKPTGEGSAQGNSGDEEKKKNGKGKGSKKKITEKVTGEQSSANPKADKEKKKERTKKVD